MGDGIVAGVFIGIVFTSAVWLVVSLYHQSFEWRCEKDFNVYDCEYEWYPVFEEGPEEELIP